MNQLTRDKSAGRAGWSQVWLASLLMLATLPGRTQGLGLITEPLLADLHFDRVGYATMNLWATLLGAVLCLPAGWAIDRIGLRWVSGPVVLGLGFTVWQVSAVHGGVVLFFLLLLATRALGQSALSVCSIATVGRWFPRGSGFAMGVYSVLLSVGFALAFGLIGYVVREHGWRPAWLQIALALLFVVAPVVTLALREPPRPVADPAVVGPAATAAAGDSEREGFTLPQALRTGAFWLFAGAAGVFNLASSGIGLFNEAVLAERGFDQRSFHLFLAVSTLMSLGGQFLCGWLTRRHRYQSLVFAALSVYAVSLALIPLLTRPWQLWALAVLFGTAGGMIIVIFFSVWSDLFGQRQLGRIQGAAQMLTVCSSGLGPVLFAECARRTGSYASLLFTLALAVMALALAATRVRNPEASEAAPVGLPERT